VRDTEVLTELSHARDCFRTNYLGSGNRENPPIKEKKVWILMIKTGSADYINNYSIFYL
jgi:hypothetical protein